ncbi:MAG: aspartate carbamoyltransferase regulatory subunit [Candidatus Woesearchaeota archaeon]
MKDVISMRDFSKEEILYILDTTADVKKAIHDHEFNKNVFQTKYGRKVENLLEGLRVATLFIENSTRTNHSFRAAVIKAGGQFDGFPSDTYTSLKKGETWADTAAMFSGYGYNTLVIRSTTEGLPRWTKEFLETNQQQMKLQHQVINSPFNYQVPLIINGGDGKNQHPTQCFLDLFTIREIALASGKELDNLHIALLNDLAHGRTNASLMSVAHLFNWKLHFAYPQRFGPQQHRLESLNRKGVEIYDHKENFLDAMKESFIAYHSRPQKERVGKGEDLITIKKIGQINKAMYNLLGDQAPYLMHPLPVDAETFEEISADIRDHPKNITKLQSSNGLYVRIALLALNLGRMNGSYLLNNSENNIKKIELIELPLKGIEKIEVTRSGFIEKDGVVLDHISTGMGRRLAGILGFENEKLPKVISDFMPVRENFKDMVKIHQEYQLSAEQYETLALVTPNVTISFVKDGKVLRKVRPILGNWIENRVKCRNPDCVTNITKEHVVPKHRVETINGERVLECNYCELTDTIPKIYEDNRFIYMGEER